MVNLNFNQPQGQMSPVGTSDILNFQNPVDPSGGDWMTDWFGGQNQMGYIPAGIGALSAGLNAYTGFQQLGLAKDQLAFQKQAYSENMANQTKLTNAALRDRQAARYAANPNAYQNPDDYMAENKVG